MSTTLKLLRRLKYDGGLDIFGSERVAVDLTITNGTEFSVTDVIVADNFGTVTLWTAGNGGITTFELGWIISSHDGFMELRNDDSGTPEFMLVFVKANVPTPVPPFFGSSTSARIDGADLINNTDYADTDRIQFQREAADGVGDASIDIYLFN